MSKKSRGINAERDLIHKFWGVGWAAMRAAGSGSSQFPSPDVIAGNHSRKIVLEVKLTTEDKKYFSSEEIRHLKFFADSFGAEPWVGVKFFRIPWVFFSLEDLRSSGSNFVVDKKDAELRSLSFEDLVGL
ncbi:MAG: Holliday junction resolvase Hjc [Candidatus Woesearchaeota archaeon]